ncbi:MAG: universal stress protein UspA [Desulfobacteraceae bacterium IS3]|nr:MAG: universal stress protein UspA [Desulfobacteraceae bacterium IS3]
MNIVIGYDGTNESKNALNLAKFHAKSFNAKVFAVASLTGGKETLPADIETAEQDLEYAQGVFEAESISCEKHLLIRGMSPGEDLVQFAEDSRADEIIIGVRKRSKVGKLLFGSTAQYVILNSPCPVVTVR